MGLDVVLLLSNRGQSLAGLPPVPAIVLGHVGRLLAAADSRSIRVGAPRRFDKLTAGKLGIYVNHFAQTKAPTENHSILARLPIHTYWTTNYDKLIEEALKAAKKVPDVKYTHNQLSVTRMGRDAVIYKMHGDVDHPTEAVICRDDYEAYAYKMGEFVSALRGDLIEKTFLFLGFSFTDPNIDFILSRVRALYDKNQRQHYCIQRAVSKKKGETPFSISAAERADFGRTTRAIVSHL